MITDFIGDLQRILILTLVYVCAITPAGWFRAYVAKKMGDNTAEQMGLLTLSPLEHFDSMGYGFLIFSRYLFGNIIGWGRQVPINKNNFNGPYGRLYYFVALFSDVFMHLILASFSIALVIMLFNPVAQIMLRNMALKLLFLGTAIASIDSAVIQSLPSSFSITIGYVLIIFFYINIFFAVVSALSSFITATMSYLSDRFNIEDYYPIVFIGVIIVAIFLGIFLRPLFNNYAILLGNKWALFFKA